VCNKGLTKKKNPKKKKRARGGITVAPVKMLGETLYRRRIGGGESGGGGQPTFVKKLLRGTRRGLKSRNFGVSGKVWGVEIRQTTEKPQNKKKSRTAKDPPAPGTPLIDLEEVVEEERKYGKRESPSGRGPQAIRLKDRERGFGGKRSPTKAAIRPIFGESSGVPKSRTKKSYGIDKSSHKKT